MSVQDLGSRIEGMGDVHGAAHRGPDSRCAHKYPRLAPRLGVTLIELLITITIISILSAAFLGTSNLAMESSRKARTKTTIGKIHGLLMEKWSEYATRRVDIDQQVLQQLESNISTLAGTDSEKRRIRGMALADLRLLAVRELMKLEMPDRWTDVTGNNINNSLPNASDSGFFGPSVLTARPALSSTYLRRYRSLPTTDEQQLLNNQGAECLYLTIMLGTGDGEARTLFSEQNIGDTDGDGAKEFLDGWGRPITYVRWPAGFVSDLIPLDENGNRLTDQDHDPFDVFRRDQLNALRMAYANYPNAAIGSFNSSAIRLGVSELADDIGAYRLVPLIYSSGSDGRPGILTSRDTVIGLYPYLTLPEGMIGSAIAEAGVEQTEHLDNIHNHLQDNK